MFNILSMRRLSYQQFKLLVVSIFFIFGADAALAELAPCAICSTEQGRIHNEDCSLSESWNGDTFYFCQSRCLSAFKEDPASWATRFAALQKSDSSKDGIAEGDSLPRFRLPLEPVGSISTEDLIGKVVLINGWAGWCAPCLEEMPALIKLQEEFRENGLVVLGLSFDKSREKHRAAVAEQKLNFTSIYADQPEVQEFLKSLGKFEAIPFTLVVDQDGKLVKRLNQAATYEEFRGLVEPLLIEQESPPEEANSGSVVPS